MAALPLCADSIAGVWLTVSVVEVSGETDSDGEIILNLRAAFYIFRRCVIVTVIAV